MDMSWKVIFKPFSEKFRSQIRVVALATAPQQRWEKRKGYGGETMHERYPQSQTQPQAQRRVEGREGGRRAPQLHNAHTIMQTSTTEECATQTPCELARVTSRAGGWHFTASKVSMADHNTQVGIRASTYLLWLLRLTPSLAERPERKCSY